jgi:hypothetical protein
LKIQMKWQVTGKHELIKHMKFFKFKQFHIF